MEKKVIDQKEYLKRYLSFGSDEKRKKKKKRSKVGSKTVQVIDDDIDLKNIRPLDDNNIELLLHSEEAPQIVGVVDERALLGFKDKTKWKIIANDIDGDLTICSNEIAKEKSVKQKHSKPEKDESDDELPPARIKKHKKHKKKSESSSESDSSDTEIRKHRKKKKKSKKEESDSVLTPPRKSKNDDSDLSPPRKRKNQSESESDQSPPRRKDKKIRKNSDSDLSPPRKRKNQSDSDESPPRRKDRKNRKGSDSDLSPPRRKKKQSDSDQSPPRRKNKKIREDNDSDLSPPRKRKDRDDSNHTPPRRRKNKDSDQSPPRRNKPKENLHKSRREQHAERTRKDASDSDLSPSRQNRKNYDSDFSPPRRNKAYTESNVKSRGKEKNNHSDFSPPRGSKHRWDHEKADRSNKHSHKNKSNKNSDSDLSPPRRRSKQVDRNVSPLNRSREYSKESHDRTHKDRLKSKYNEKSRDRSDKKDKFSKHDNERRREYSIRSDSPERPEKRMKKTLDGKTAGLQDAKALREETEAFKKREAEQFSKLSKEVSGVGKATIVRDSKTGRKRDLEAEAATEREKQKRQDELNEKYSKWGKGLKQVGDREDQLKDDLYEMSKPLARYADDADLDKRLREQDREGDPMLDYIKQKQIKEGKRKPDRPVYEGSFMPNRFGIKPGHRWDGVDRSNGYEKKWFEARNAKKALQEDAYKWSTSDM